MNPDVDWYFKKPTAWQREYQALRKLALATGLTETLKWGHPCYTLADKNVVLIHGFNEYCALLLMKGALLTDPQRLLIQQTQHVQAARQLRFTKLAEIKSRTKVIKAYVREAIELEKSGRKIALKTTADFAVPAEFQQQLDRSARLTKAFAALTPGRQRGYLYFFGQAKQAATRTARVKKCAPKILAGLGLDD